MATVTIEQLDPALLQLVKEEITKVFEEEAEGWKLFKRNTSAEFINGKGFRIPIHTTPPGGHTWFSENNSDFRNPVPYKLKDMYVFPTAYALPFEFSGRAIRNMKDKSSLIKWFAEQLQMYLSTATKEIEEQLPYDGRGIKATVLSGAGTNVLVGRQAPAALAGSTKGTKYLVVDNQYDIVAPSTGAVRASGPYTVIVSGPAQVTVNGTVGPNFFLDAAVADGDLVVHVGGYNKAFRGLAYLINNGTDVLQLLSRADFPELRSPVTDLAGASLGPAAFSITKAKLQYRIGKDAGAKNLIAFLTWGQYEFLRRQGQGLRRFTNSDTVDGIAGTYTDGDTTFAPNVNLDEDRVYLLDMTDIQRYVEMDFGIYDLDGQTIRMKLGAQGVGSDKYAGAVGVSMNLGITSPMRHALIKRAAVSDIATQVNSYT
jgi:hypothetical protein